MNLNVMIDSDEAVEILTVGSLCPNCGFAELVKEGTQVFCPLCNYGAVRCT
jgi:uncharacterized Zn finger protein (UPF0148 family)